MRARRSTRTCLVVGQKPDPHIVALEAELADRGVSVTTIDSMPLNRQQEWITFFASMNGTGIRFGDGRSIVDGREVDVVFWRVKAPLFGLAFDDPQRFDFDFAYREMRKLIEGLHAAVSHAQWINAYPAHTLAGNKLYQLATATRVGFQIPRTVISNRADDVLPLFESGEVIYKTLSGPHQQRDQLILTTKISKQVFEERRETIATAPCLFQNFVAKAYEVRATVIGETIVALRIDSQRHQHTTVDWRADQLRRDLYDPIKLPKVVEARVIDFMRAMGLTYGAMDLIVTPAGETVFLEVNPGGQWLWLEKLTGTPITAAIADYIAEGVVEPCH